MLPPPPAPVRTTLIWDAPVGTARVFVPGVA